MNKKSIEEQFDKLAYSDAFNLNGQSGYVLNKKAIKQFLFSTLNSVIEELLPKEDRLSDNIPFDVGYNKCRQEMQDKFKQMNLILDK